MLIPAVIGFLGLTYFAYRLAVWGEQKHRALGTWIPLGYILVVTIGGLLYVLPETSAILQFYLLLVIFGVVAGFIGISRRPKLSHRPAAPSRSNSLTAARGNHVPAADDDPRAGMDLYADERAQNERDSAEMWDQRFRDEAAREKAEQQEEDARRAEEDYWEDRREREEQRYRESEELAERQWEEEQNRTQDNED